MLMSLQWNINFFDDKKTMEFKYAIRKWLIKQ